MKLSQFINDLFENGNVTIAGGLHEFDVNEQEATIAILQKQYQQSILEMPHVAPEFHKAAAFWGATFIYRTVQFILLRDLDEEKIKIHLQDFAGEKTPEVIYSVDLTFRYLRDLLGLAKGLSPNDPLVLRLKEMAGKWAFSSVGISGLENLEDEIIFQNNSLKVAYIDRIIAAKDLKRTHHIEVRELVAAALGDHQENFWKEFARSVNIKEKET